MSLIKFWNKKIKTLDWKDVGLIKLSTAAFILMIAKLWEPILSLNWYWYAILFAIAAIKPFYKCYLSLIKA